MQAPAPDLSISGNRRALSPRARKASATTSNPPQSARGDTLLTEQLLLYLTNCQSLQEIQVVAIRSRLLTRVFQTLAACSLLRIAYLSGNRISDLPLLPALTTLRKLDLSANEISVLPPAAAWEPLSALQIFYLHDNQLSEWTCLKSLLGLPSVLHLTLFNNPVVSVPGYRHFLVNGNQKLLALDTFLVTDEERLQDACFGYRFRSMNEFMKLHLPDFPPHKTATQHLFNLEVDIYRLKRLYEKNSPVIQIQRAWRGYVVRHAAILSNKTRRVAAQRIQRVTRGWLLRKHLREQLKLVLQQTHEEYLMFTEKELEKDNAILKINHAIMLYVTRKRLHAKKTKAATLIQKIVRGYLARTHSFAKGLQFTRWPYFYLLRQQRGLLFKVFDAVGPKLLEKELIPSTHKLRKYVLETTRYQTLRSTDPEVVKYSHLPCVQFCRPLMFGRVLLRKHKRPWPKKKPISSAYTWRDQRSVRLLKILPQLSCRVRKRPLIKLIKRRKQRYRKLGLIEDDYNDFYMFRPQNGETLYAVCRGILDYNRKAAEEGRTQLLAYFQPGLQRIVSCIRLQALFRSFQIRKKNPTGFAEKIVERRAASSIQNYWRYLLLKKRMHALSLIARHLRSINSRILYVEQWVYLNLEHIVQIHVKHTRFQQQHICFDFLDNSVRVSYPGHPLAPDASGHSVHPEALGLARYGDSPSACPRWMLGGEFVIPHMSHSPGPFSNYVPALFHCSRTFAELKSYPQIVGAACGKTGVGSEMRFVKLTYQSVEEARRRAYIIAVLSHSFISQSFVKLFTQKQLEQGFWQINVRELWELYNLKGVQDVLEPPNLRQKAIAPLKRQPHAGLVFRDARTLSEVNLDTTVYHIPQQTKRGPASTPIFHSEFSSGKGKFLNSITPELPSMSTAAVGPSQSLPGDGPSFTPMPRAATISVPMAKMQSSVSISSQPTKNEILTSFVQLNAAKVKLQREINREKIANDAQATLDGKQEAARTQKGINQTIRNQQRMELERNLSEFQSLNQSEKKQLRAEREARQEQERVHRNVLREQVQSTKNKISLHRSQASFAAHFNQQKNLICKQLRIGEMRQKAKQDRSSNSLQVAEQRAHRISGPRIQRSIKIPLQASLFDTQSALTSNPSQRAPPPRQGSLHCRVGSTLPPIQTPLTIGPFDRHDARSTEPLPHKIDRSVLSSTFESIASSPKNYSMFFRESPTRSAGLYRRKDTMPLPALTPVLPRLLLSSQMAHKRKFSSGGEFSAGSQLL